MKKMIAVLALSVAAVFPAQASQDRTEAICNAMSGMAEALLTMRQEGYSYEYALSSLDLKRLNWMVDLAWILQHSEVGSDPELQELVRDIFRMSVLSACRSARTW